MLLPDDPRHLNSRFNLESIESRVQAGFLVIVITNQTGVARGECAAEGLRRIRYKMETLLGRGHAWIDVLYCPHHPDNGFVGEATELKIDCDRRKPKTGMFERAAPDWNVSLPESYGVGDSRRDVLAARRMGLRTIGVKTGHGCRDCGASEWPDQLADDLGEAVDFILAAAAVEPAEGVRA